MATPFSQTSRALAAERSALPSVVLGTTTLLLGLGLAWFISAELPVSVISTSARIEALAAGHVVSSEVAGRLEAVHARPGSRVEAGALLFELATELDDAEIAEQAVAVETLIRELEAADEVLRQERTAITARRESGEATTRELDSRANAARAEAELAAEEAARAERAAAAGLLAEAELRRAQATANARLADAETARRAVERTRVETESELRDRAARLAERERERTALAGRIEGSRAAQARRRTAAARARVCAPIAGLVAELSPATPGTYLAAGTPLATLLPAGGVRIVAAFAPGDALGRIAPGQRAELRLDGFAWTHFGSLAARVERADAEPRDGRLRIEAALEAPVGAPIPLRHGLPGTLTVEIERISPAALLLRSAGAGK